MCDEGLNALWARFDARHPVFAGDDVSQWPASCLERLLAARLLREAANAEYVDCNACAQGHREKVQYIESPPGSGFRAYIVCPENGRVWVPPYRLRQWEIDLASLARALAEALPAAAGVHELATDRVWLLGKTTIGGQAKEAFLVRGARWADFQAVLAGARRFKEATQPVVLVADVVPSQKVWGGDAPAIFVLRELARLEGSSLVVDRVQMDRVLGRGRRRASLVTVVAVPTPQGAQWKDLSLVVDDLDFRFQVLGKRGKRTFQEAGFENRVKRGFPDHRWELLRFFARDSGPLLEEALDSRAKNNLKQYVSELRKRLRAVFPGIDGNPIDKPAGERYQTAFKITARDGIVLPLPADTAWSRISVVEARDGRIRFTVDIKRRFLAYSDGHAEDRGHEVAERPETTTWEHDLWTLGLLDDDGAPTEVGNALLDVLRGRGRVKRGQNDKAMIHLGSFLSRLTGITAPAFEFSAARKEWTSSFEAASETSSGNK